jgi:hypothetical protein
VPLIVEEDEAADLPNIVFFSAIGVVLEPNDLTNLVKELSGWVLHSVK